MLLSPTWSPGPLVPTCENIAASYNYLSKNSGIYPATVCMLQLNIPSFQFIFHAFVFTRSNFHRMVAKLLFLLWVCFLVSSISTATHYSQISESFLARTFHGYDYIALDERHQDTGHNPVMHWWHCRLSKILWNICHLSRNSVLPNSWTPCKTSVIITLLKFLHRYKLNKHFLILFILSLHSLCLIIKLRYVVKNCIY